MDSASLCRSEIVQWTMAGPLGRQLVASPREEIVNGRVEDEVDD